MRRKYGAIIGTIVEKAIGAVSGDAGNRSVHWDNYQFNCWPSKDKAEKAYEQAALKVSYCANIKINNRHDFTKRTASQNNIYANCPEGLFIARNLMCVLQQ